MPLCYTCPSLSPPRAKHRGCPRQALGSLVHEHLWSLVVINYRVFNIERACTIDLRGLMSSCTARRGV